MIRTTAASGSLVYCMREPLAFAETSAAGLAVQPSDGFVFAHPFSHREVADVEAIEVSTFAVWAGEER